MLLPPSNLHIFLLPAVTPASYIITTYHSTLREYESVVWHSRLLGLGMPPNKLPDTDYAQYTPPVENGVPSVLSPSLTALVNKAAFGNACEFLASVRPGFNVSACEAFNGGVMKRGLNAAIQQWYLNAQEAGERQVRGQFIVGHLFEGAAWSIPQSIFNYSTAVRHTEGIPLRRCKTLLAVGNGNDETATLSQHTATCYSILLLIFCSGRGALPSPFFCLLSTSSHVLLAALHGRERLRPVAVLLPAQGRLASAAHPNVRPQLHGRLA